MADDLPDFPIVELEADSPEQIGQVGLFDYLMPVGSTGIIFIAAVPGILYQWGIGFTDAVKVACNLRAASTLVHMGLIRGETFAFMRSALQLSQSDLATAYGVSLATVQGWENNTIELPRLVWSALATDVGRADNGRGVPSEYALTPDFRPRRIRVFPSVPMTPGPTSFSLPCTPPEPLVNPNCEPFIRPPC